MVIAITNYSLKHFNKKELASILVLTNTTNSITFAINALITVKSAIKMNAHNAKPISD